ncbi:hypothetical protein BJ508DRAFT_414944, partial [Ascobolus immersus RN42]
MQYYNNMDTFIRERPTTPQQHLNPDLSSLFSSKLTITNHPTTTPPQPSETDLSSLLSSKLTISHPSRPQRISPITTRERAHRTRCTKSTPKPKPQPAKPTHNNPFDSLTPAVHQFSSLLCYAEQPPNQMPHFYYSRIYTLLKLLKSVIEESKPDLLEKHYPSDRVWPRLTLASADSLEQPLKQELLKYDQKYAAMRADPRNAADLAYQLAGLSIRNRATFDLRSKLSLARTMLNLLRIGSGSRLFGNAGLKVPTCFAQAERLLSELRGWAEGGSYVDPAYDHV